MPAYLVTATPIDELFQALADALETGLVEEMEPFGEELSNALKRARMQPDGTAVWEEVCFCSVPLAQEREGMLDRYFRELSTTEVSRGDGWRRIEDLPRLF